MSNEYQDFESEAGKILENLLKEHNIDPQLYEQLLDEENKRVHLKRRRGVKEQLRKIIEQVQD
jgi:hypothetical protein